jgi:Protein of unknown function (DUF3040)
VALSMEEQRMLDEMERQLAAADPRLASRFNSFGEQRLPGTFSSQRAKTISGLIALALIAAVTVMMFVFSPYHTQPTSSPGRGNTTTHAGTAKSGSGGSHSTGSDSASSGSGS